MGRLKIWGQSARPARPVADRLDSWKEIAAYLNRTPRSVQRWETEESLPVHRLQHKKGGSVYALKHELDEWWESRQEGLSERKRPVPVVPMTGRKRPSRPMRLIAVAAVLVAAGIAAWVSVSRSELSAGPSPPIPLTSLPGEEWHGALSPDGTKIAFEYKAANRNNYDIYLKLIGEETAISFAASDKNEVGVAWSPDGRWIAFVRVLPTGAWEIVRRMTIGGPVERLAETDGPPTELEMKSRLGPWVAWSPDGAWLVTLDRESEEDPYGLFALSLATRQRHRLTTPLAGSLGDAGPSFAPDGRSIAFNRFHGLTVSHVYVLEVSDGVQPIGEPRKLTPWIARNYAPVWTPDGREILFSVTSSSLSSVFRIPASGSGQPERVVAAEGSAWFPQVSAETNRLVYSRLDLFGGIWHTDLTGLEGHAPEPETLIASSRLDLQPEYSPDGRRIAFTSTRSGSREIWVCNSDGSNPQKLTSFGSAHNYGPCWSPDGRQIAFASDKDGHYDIYVIPARGGQPVPIAKHAADDNAPRWSGDGRWIYFTSNRGGVCQIWRIPVGGGEAAQITSGGGGGARLSGDGESLYFSKSDFGPTSVWRVPVDGGEEVEVLDASWGVTEFAVTAEGIYFIPTPDVNGRRHLLFHDFGTESVKSTAVISGHPTTAGCTCEHWSGYGLTVSPDGRSILYGKLDRIDSDIMLVENFR